MVKNRSLTNYWLTHFITSMGERCHPKIVYKLLKPCSRNLEILIPTLVTLSVPHWLLYVTIDDSFLQIVGSWLKHEISKYQGVKLIFCILIDYFLSDCYSVCLRMFLQQMQGRGTRIFHILYKYGICVRCYWFEHTWLDAVYR